MCQIVETLTYDDMEEQNKFLKKRNMDLMK